MHAADVQWNARIPAPNSAPAGQDLGRALFALSRANVGPADEGALSISCGPLVDATVGNEHGGSTEAEYDVGTLAAYAPFEAKDA